MKKSEKLYRHLSAVTQKTEYFRPWQALLNQWSDDWYASVFSKFPVASKEVMLANSEAFFSDDVKDFAVSPTIGLFTVDRSGVLHKELIPEVTSGSSGFPMKIFKTNEERIRLAMSAWNNRSLIDAKANQNNMFCLIHAHGTQPKVVTDTRDYNPANITKVLNFLSTEMKPRLVHGTPSDLYEYAQFIINNNYDLGDWKPTFIESNSEHLEQQQKDAIETAFKARVYNNYGALEFWSIAYECPHGAMHISKDIFVEVVDSESGAPIETGNGVYGDLLVTSMVLKAQPFIRYRIGDIGRINVTPCACGNHEPILELYQVRRINLVNRYAGSGKMVNGVSLFKGAIWDVLAEHDFHIRRYKVIQTGPTHFKVHIDIDADRFSDFSESFARNARRRLETEDATFEFIPTTADAEVFKGKNYSFISMVN